MTTIQRQATTTPVINPLDTTGETATTGPQEETMEEAVEEGNITGNPAENSSVEEKAEAGYLSSPIFIPAAIGAGVLTLLLAVSVYLLKKPKNPKTPGDAAIPLADGHIEEDHVVTQLMRRKGRERRSRGNKK